MYNIAGVVILYHPNEQESFYNILSYSNYLNKLFIVDNSEKESLFIKNNALKLNPNIVYLHDGENQGIAFRLNQIVKICLEEKFDWLLTMDQDSSFQEKGFEKYLLQFSNYKKADVAIFSVNFLPSQFPVSEEPTEVLSTITSGSLVNLSLSTSIGKYNEDLFIDFVDAAYSYNATNLGYKIIQFRNIILNHAMGEIQYGRSLKSFKLTPRVLYSPMRMYYIIRNTLYMLYKFPNLPEAARSDLKKSSVFVKNALLYHKQRWKMIKYITKAYIDFKKNKMGKLQA